jgi:hypothetical protein
LNSEFINVVLKKKSKQRIISSIEMQEKQLLVKNFERFSPNLVSLVIAMIIEVLVDKVLSYFNSISDLKNNLTSLYIAWLKKF